MVKKHIFIFGVSILLLIFLAVTLFYYLNKTTIEPSGGTILYKSNSNYFSIEEKNPKILNYYLQRWNIWKSDSTANKTRGKIERVIIELTDEKQDSYVISDTSKPPIMQGSSSAYREGGDLLIQVYVNPKTNTLSQEAINKNVLFLVMNELYDSTKSTSYDSVTSALAAFYADSKIRPFVVTVKK